MITSRKKTLLKQECIPVGGVLPAAVAAIRCTGDSLSGGPKSPPGQRQPRQISLTHTDIPRRGMGPGTGAPLPRRNIGPGSQTGSDIIQRPPEQNDTHVQKHYLAPNFVRGR